MNSGGHRGFTVVTVVTLVFAPFFSHHHWMWRFVGKTKETHIEQCAPKQPCPRHKRIVKIVKLGQPPALPPRGHKHLDDTDAVGVVVDDPNSVDPGDDDGDQPDPPRRR